LERPDTTEENAEKLFAELDPARTGLANFANDYSSPDVWGAKWRQYLFGAIGTGVAAGDVDGDGKPDLFVISKDETSRLYLNLGDFRFKDATARSGIAKADAPAGGAAFADVNGDGHLDLYLCYSGAPNQLWINDGARRFEERAAAWGVDVRSGSVMGVFGDYDRDGRLDLYLVANLLYQDGRETPMPDRLFRNRGERFEEVTDAAGIEDRHYGHAAVWWDFNDDGWPDIYVANDFSGLDRLYKNRKDGTFENVIESVAPRVPYYSMGVDFGDIDNDGLSDLLLSDMVPPDRYSRQRSVGAHWRIVEQNKPSATPQYLQNAPLLQLSESGFADIAYQAGLARTGWTWAPRLADLDNDGRLDAFFTNGMLRPFNDADLGRRFGSGARSHAQWARAYKQLPVLAEPNLAFRNEGGLRFAETGAAWGLDRKGVSFGAALADFDGDGALDIAVNNWRRPPSLFRNRGTQGRRILVSLVGSSSNRFGVGARVEAVSGNLRQTKTLNPYRGYMSADQPLLHFGLGRRQSVDTLEIRWPSGVVQRFQSLPAGRRYEIVEPNAAAEPLERPQNRKPRPGRFARARLHFPSEAARKPATGSEFDAQPLKPFAESGQGGVAAAGDLDGDGRPELVIGGAAGQSTAIFRAAEDGRFEAIWSLDLDEDFPSEDAALALADFDSDGDLDLLAASGGSLMPPGDAAYKNRLYLNDGEARLQRAFETALSEPAISTTALAVADFDRDGRPDVFAGGGSIPGRFPEPAESQLWRGLGDGRFERAEVQQAPGLGQIGRIAAAAWADIDGDNWPDLVLLRAWGSPQLWRNREGRLERDADAFSSHPSTGLWTALAIADFDGNGRLDVAAGNLGLNTPYGASPKESGRLWFRSRESGVDILETVFDGGREWPRANKDFFERAFPEALSSIDSFAKYAASPVEDLLGELPKAGFEPLAIDDARTGVFWQSEDGTFRFQPLPAFAQTGRAMDLIATDIDQNGSPDLILALEPPSPAPWTGRPERGHLALLVNQGDRRFEAEKSWASGLSVGSTSPRQLLWADLDGDGRNCLVVSRTKGKPLIFKPRTLASEAGSNPR